MTPALPARCVFVYGTLRRGEQRDINRLTPAPRWLRQASVYGVLYDLGEYPGLVLASDQRPGQDAGRVSGEVYEITVELERLLDEIEAVAPRPSGEYAKREVRVSLELPVSTNEGGPAPALTCLVYEVMPARLAGCPVIAGGDWVSYRLQLQGGHST
jgi:gamma-glutamylcyclotransferase (GGCT)/AIG2-like uncharacterized protein YtfP